MRNASTRKLVLISLLSALCYIILYFKIPIPAPVGNPMIHLGNMLVLLFALMFGGPIGGLCGSIGMGLFDLLNGYHLYAPKTIILKFLMGITCGIVFGFSKSSLKDKINIIVLFFAIVFTAVGSIVLALYIQTGGVISVPSVESSITLSPVLYITSYILSAFMFGCYIFMRGKNDEYKCALFACTCGVLVNVVGEFLLGALQYTITTGIAIEQSLVLSAISLPATLMNGIISILIAVNLFYILKNKTNILDNWKNL